MKSAEERAQQALDAVRSNPSATDACTILADLFREFARDQRYLCADKARKPWLNQDVSSFADPDAAYITVMNTPLPGEDVCAGVLRAIATADRKHAEPVYLMNLAREALAMEPLR